MSFLTHEQNGLMWLTAPMLDAAPASATAFPPERAV